MTKLSAATNLRTFRTFLLMQQFAAAEIGARIAQARKEAGGMTQEELADLLNVSKRSVQDYEAGVTIPWRHFQRLETIFPNRSMAWFLHGDAAAEAPSPATDVVMAEIAERLVHVEQLLEGLAAQPDGDDLESPRASEED